MMAGWPQRSGRTVRHADARGLYNHQCKSRASAACRAASTVDVLLTFVSGTAFLLTKVRLSGSGYIIAVVRQQWEDTRAA